MKAGITFFDYSQHCYGNRSAAAGNPGLSGVQDRRATRQGRHRAEVQHLQTRLSDQGRHSSHARRRGHDRAVTIERASAIALVAAFGAIQFSIAAGQSLFALAALGWAVSLLRSRHAPAIPAFFLPLVLYAVWTLVATVYSRDPGESLNDDKELLLLLVVPMTMTLLRGDRAARALDVLISIGPIVALVGVYQYALLDYDSLGQRPKGTLGHYMTYSGVLMLLVCATAARLLYEPGRRIWPALIMPALIVALAATLSRNAYVGALVGVGVLLLLRDFRLLALLPVAIAGIVLFAPSGIVDRAYSMFDLKDPTTRDRVA